MGCNLRVEAVQLEIIFPDGFRWTEVDQKGGGQVRHRVQPVDYSDFGSGARIAQEAGDGAVLSR